jgi:hypothetical protein
MRRFGLALLVVPLAVAMSTAPARAADPEAVPLYTSEDLDRMFGPAPAGPSVPVDKSRPEDWAWVEQFIDRQYARVDADRRYDLDRRALDVAASRQEPAWTGYGRPLAWELGYPASTWWHTVWGQYSRSGYGGYRTAGPVARSPYARAMGEMTRPMGEMTRRSGTGHARRSK